MKLDGSWVDNIINMSLDYTEAYEIDIINGGTVVRTLFTSSPTVTYTAANQTTDFGSAQTSLTFNVYQMSAQYGRGIVGSYSGAIT